MSSKVSAAVVERMRDLMQDGKQRSCTQASSELGISNTSSQNAMNVLHMRKRVFIAGYERCEKGTSWVRIFQQGKRVDSQKPVGPEKSKRKYLRKEREYLAEARASGTKVFRHPWDEWLFGATQIPTKPHPFESHIHKMSMSVTQDEDEAEEV